MNQLLYLLEIKVNSNFHAFDSAKLTQGPTVDANNWFFCCNKFFQLGNSPNMLVLLARLLRIFSDSTAYVYRP